MAAACCVRHHFVLPAFNPVRVPLVLSFFRSCSPAPVTTCPPGFFCGSLVSAANSAGLDWSSLKKAYWVAANVKDSVAQPPAVVTTICPGGFYCPNSTTILTCPSGYYCPEQTVSPAKCGALAVCPAQSAFPVDFAAILLAAILTALFASASRWQNNVQKDQERLSRSFKTSVQAGAGNTTTNKTGAAAGHGLAIALEGLTASTSDGSVRVLKGVTAHIPEGRLTGIFGPSRGGKSTVLEAIRTGGAQLDSGNVVVQLDGRPIQSGAELASRIAFVPQEDISVDRTLTVRELLRFSARSRRPQLSGEAAEAVVNGVLAELGLLSVADTVIGGGENAAANISGGQLKRVNIAQELVAVSRPGAVCCLDEFTAGLDSAVALDLVQTVLQPLAKEGVTVVCVMQQPRPEIFEQLHHVLLLQRGSVVYEGSPAGVSPHLADLGFVQPAEASDADFALDVLNGVANNSKGDVDLAAAWARRSGGAGAFSFSKESATSATAAQAHELQQHSPSCCLSLTNALDLVWLHANRAMTVRLRNTRQLWIYSLLHVLMAASLSVGFSVLIQGSWRGTLNPPAASLLADYCPSVLGSLCDEKNVMDIGFAQLLFFAATAIGIGASLATIPLFGQQVPIIRREAASGLHPLAYMAGRLACDALFTVWYAIIFTGCWMLFAHPGPWYGWLGVVIPTAFATAGLGAFTVALTGGRTLPAAVMSIVLIIFFAVFSGVEPTLASVQDLPVVNWLWYVSFSTWRRGRGRRRASRGSSATASPAIAALDAL